MFEDFFENNAPADEEKPDAAHTEQIKAAVMERIALDSAHDPESEEKKMKHKFIRPFIIAAAVIAVSAGSLVTANAATNGAVADTITKAFSVFININGEQVEAEGEMSEIVMEDGSAASVLTFELPDDAVSSVDGLTIAVEADGDAPTEITFSSEGDGASGGTDEISVYYYDGSSLTPAEPDVTFTENE